MIALLALAVCADSAINYCAPLVPTPDLDSVTATVELIAPSGPFDVPMTRDGVFNYGLVINAEGLPPASSLGPYRVYVAWATSLTMDSVVKLGVIRNGRNTLEALPRNQFRVLVSAEASSAVTSRHGRLVLRGSSPSVRWLAHRDLFLSTPGMIAMTHHMADVGTLRDARPSSTLTLHDGDTLALAATRVSGGYAYNGEYPGPKLIVPKGSRITVRFENQIDQPTTVHWHGVRVDNPNDGAGGLTQDPVPPGGSFTYHVHFPDVGVFWYHAHENESEQIGRGLFGNILVTDSAADQEALAIQDVSPSVPFGGQALMGRFGETFLVNGSRRYSLTVHRGSIVRFLLTNASNARTYNLSFSSARMTLVGSDLGNFEHAQVVPSILIAPGERYAVDVRFSGTSVLTNRVQALNHVIGVFTPEVDTLGVMHADALRAVTRPVEYPSTPDLQSYRRYLDRPVDHRLNLEMRLSTLANMLTGASVPVEVNDGMPTMNQMITSRDVTWILRDPDTGAENMDIDWQFRSGSVAKIRIYNDAVGPHPMAHPIHVHGQRMLLLSRNGVPNANLVWKDTILVPAGETDDVLIELSNPGRWMLHCHIAEHRASGMMMAFDVN
jgi:suppressor of ftsI